LRFEKGERGGGERGNKKYENESQSKIPKEPQPVYRIK
jgi:hypothetical protein